MMTALTIRLPEDIQNRLFELSENTGRSKSYYIREALIEYLEDLEDIYLAEKELEDLRANRTHTIPIEEVMKEYDLL
jgi:RHH-type rel operon transcriptional repressor/antitoxin RelB